MSDAFVPVSWQTARFLAEQRLISVNFAREMV